MRLLVSVTCAKEAIAALDGGADFIDAKDPSIGALGAVSIEVLPQILNAVAGARQVTAALGEATSEKQLERSAAQFSSAGVALIKVGFAGTAETAHVAGLIQAAMRERVPAVTEPAESSRSRSPIRCAQRFRRPR